MNKSKRNLSIADAKAIAQKYNKEGVIVFYLNGDQIGYVSYGRDKGLCGTVRRIADRMMDSLMG